MFVINRRALVALVSCYNVGASSVFLHATTMDTLHCHEIVVYPPPFLPSLLPPLPHLSSPPPPPLPHLCFLPLPLFLTSPSPSSSPLFPPPPPLPHLPLFLTSPSHSSSPLLPPPPLPHFCFLPFTPPPSLQLPTCSHRKMFSLTEHISVRSLLPCCMERTGP